MRLPAIWAALFLYFVPLRAQPNLDMSCTASAQPYTCRSEGLAEPTGDIIITCTGGTPTPVGQPVPRVNVFAGLNTNVANINLGNGGNDAVLSLDNPAPANQIINEPQIEPNIYVDW